MPASSPVCVVLMAVGFVLLLFAFNMDAESFNRIPEFALGSLLFLVPLSILYYQATQVQPAPVLKILDWALVVLVVLMMPLFEVIAAPPLFWLYFVLLPAVSFRLVVSSRLQGYLKLSPLLKRKLMFIAIQLPLSSLAAYLFRSRVWFINDKDRIGMDNLLTVIVFVIVPALAILVMYEGSAKSDIPSSASS